MNKKIGNISMALGVIFLVTGTLSSDVLTNQGYIKRLTHSGNNSVQYPWLSDDGQWMLYVQENDTGEEITRSIRLMDVDTGKETELFQDKKIAAPEPYEEVTLLVGTKPPMLSGNGRVAVFVLSLDQPENILDHFLAITNTDGTGFKIISFPIESLQGKDWNSLDFQAKEWERISHYAVNSDGSRVACVMKGHLGPIRYGNASAIILIDTHSGKQKTILAPELNENQWEWTGFPSRPLLGGGWAFSINGSGDKILFGAQSSDDQLDYDIYLSDWEGSQIKKITDFHDRWFSLAELSRDGKKIALFYTGKKKQGIGTYLLRSDASELEYVESRISPRVEFFDLSGNGQYIVYKHIYNGVLLDIETGEEGVAFDKNTQGYVSGLIPMDFPRFPAFWGPHIMSHDGTRILLAGIPEGKKNPELYLLNFETKE
jgi:dipeptidyl aminopeptidase/acylaminoacyl peptidase